MYEQAITCLISTSPIPSHPSTAIVDETVASIRHHLPDIPIFLMCDGVRPEQEHHTIAYAEYKKELVRKMLFGDYGNLLVFPFPRFFHQASMTRSMLEMVATPQILFCEGDTPLLLNRPIDWDLLIGEVHSGNTNHVRLHYDETIHPEHQHMIRGKLTPNLIKCVQYHNRPFIASTIWFKELLDRNFTPASRSYIEDVVYSPISCAPWEDYKLCIYDPHGTGEMMKRSSHTCGRGEDQKFEIVR